MNKIQILVFVIFTCILSACFYPKQGRVVATTHSYWKDTLTYQNDEKELLKTYFALVQAFENNDTLKLKSMKLDTIKCAECHMVDNAKVNGEDKEIYTKTEYLKIGWNAYLYWPKSDAGAVIHKDREPKYEVYVSSKCYGEECSTTVLMFEKRKK